MSARRKRLSKKGAEEEPTVHEELKGLSVKVDKEGKFVVSKDFKEITDFLTRHVKDRKLAHIQESEEEADTEEETDANDAHEEEADPEDEDKEVDRITEAFLNGELPSSEE